MASHLKKADALIAMAAEVEAARKKHEEAFNVYKATSIEDPSWNDKLLELNRLSRELNEKVEESREMLAKSKGFDSYREMTTYQPLS